MDRHRSPTEEAFSGSVAGSTIWVNGATQIPSDCAENQPFLTKSVVANSSLAFSNVLSGFFAQY
jgi:hypothetical protein